MIFAMNTQIEKACSIVGGQTALAKAIGVTTPTVNQWVSGIRPVPVERCVAIELATGGKVSRKHLRPNDWKKIWPELESKKAA